MCENTPQSKPPFWIAAVIFATAHLLVVGCLICYSGPRWMLPDGPVDEVVDIAIVVLCFPAHFLIERFVDEHPLSLLLLPLNSILWGCILAKPFGKWLLWPMYRFSLRTMLITMTLIAVALGLIPLRAKEMELAMFGIGPIELLLLAVAVGIVVLIVRARKG
jgi:hypothetical protein